MFITWGVQNLTFFSLFFFPDFRPWLHSDEQVYIKADDGDVKPELPEEDDKPELPDEIGQKKIRATGSQMTSTNDSADAHLLENAQKCTRENWMLYWD